MIVHMSDRDALYYPKPFEDWRVDVNSNETECAVTVTHIPTGITETCSDQPSRLLNLREAFRRAEQRIAGLLTDTTHHVGSRRPCADCGTQVFEYASEVDAAGLEVRHFCRMCADRRRGATLCRMCRRPIAYSTGEWVHTTATTFAIKHPATPEEG